MQLEQKQALSQKLVLTQAMRQSLDCLQLSAPELSDYGQEIALSNPLLDASRIPGTAFLPPMQRIYRISPPF